MPTFEQIITAEFDFTAIKDLLFKLYTHPHIDGILQPVRDFRADSPIVWFAIVAVIGLVLAFLGKRIIWGPVLVGIFAFAYAGGAAYIAPRLDNLVGEFLPIDPTVVGLVIAGIAAILFVPIYFGILALGSGYATYLIVYPIANALFGSTTAIITGLCFAVGVVILIFIFRKWVEMGATALVGGYLFMLAVHFIVPQQQIVNYIIWFVVAIAGMVVQIKTRKRF